MNVRAGEPLGAGRRGGGRSAAACVCGERRGEGAAAMAAIVVGQRAQQRRAHGVLQCRLLPPQ
eukprot:1198350-Pyramimonas_sp.AAC.1